MKKSQAPFVLILFSFAICFLNACYYANENSLVVSDPPNGEDDCESAVTTYAKDVLPIIEENCLNCHSRSLKLGGVNLEGYNNLILYAQGGSLLGSIDHQQGYAAMPPNGGKLSDCDIAYVRNWIDAGAKND